MSVISCVQDYHNPFQTISLLLLLSNDVELNPGPDQVTDQTLLEGLAQLAVDAPAGSNKAYHPFLGT